MSVVDKSFIGILLALAPRKKVQNNLKLEVYITFDLCLFTIKFILF